MVISNPIINETSSSISSKWKQIKHKFKKAKRCTEKHEAPFENINEEFYKYDSLSTKISIAEAAEKMVMLCYNSRLLPFFIFKNDILN